ncbi:MAG TPA: hypothetical protein VMP01_25570 [Pirellulaceae bacterium]|nr:hypothetical protein [Pirellulaceae bacterium]
MRAAAELPAIALLLSACAVSFAAELELRQIKDGGKLSAFEVAGLTKDEAATLAKLAADDAAWPRILAVYVAGEAPRGDIPPMLGTYSIRETALRFTPKYPLKAGLRYRITFQPAAIGDPHATEFPGDRLVTVYVPIPAAARGEPTKVAAVYPSAATLPENQLRFYLHFSAPMSRGEVYQRVRLLDEKGKLVEFPFLEIGEELWDKSGTRLTLLIDPGRIKRGLRPREEDGPVLEAGRKYKLVIDKRWRDASGQALASNHEKPFTVGPPMEKALDTADWKVEPPAAGAQRPLVVRFPAPLDHALLERTIDVVSAGGKPMAGDVTIADEEKTWRFTPATPWQAGKYELAIDKTLEDLVGNRIGVPFEVDRTGPIDKQVKVEIHRVPFEVK